MSSLFDHFFPALSTIRMPPSGLQDSPISQVARPFGFCVLFANMGNTERIFDKGVTQGKGARGAGRGCAQQHRRDLGWKRGRPLLLRRETTRRPHNKNQISWVYCAGSVKPRGGVRKAKPPYGASASLARPDNPRILFSPKFKVSPMSPYNIDSPFFPLDFFPIQLEDQFHTLEKTHQNPGYLKDDKTVASSLFLLWKS